MLRRLSRRIRASILLFYGRFFLPIPIRHPLLFVVRVLVWCGLGLGWGGFRVVWSGVVWSGVLCVCGLGWVWVWFVLGGVEWGGLFGGGLD